MAGGPGPLDVLATAPPCRDWDGWELTRVLATHGVVIPACGCANGMPPSIIHLQHDRALAAKWGTSASLFEGT